MSVRRVVFGVAALCLMLSGCAASPTPSPPVAPVKDPASLSSPEVNELIVECLRSKGWEVLRGRTWSQYIGPEEQRGAYDDDRKECRKELGFDQVTAPTYTPEYLAKKWEQERATWECLVEQGMDVPELPSVQAYTDMFFNEGTVFSSYENLPPGNSMADELREICGDPIESWTSDF